VERFTWERSRGEAQKLAAMGMGEAAAGPPDWHPDALLAAHAWHWLGGWQPTALPLYCSLHDVTDLDLLTELLLVVRKHTSHGEH
jgi:hypothetical protein